MTNNNETLERLIDYFLNKTLELEKELKATNDMLFKTEDALRIATHNNNSLMKEIEKLKKEYN